MQIEHRIVINATTERIFTIYSDVANWNTWDPDTRTSSLNGPFQAGTTGSLTPTKGRTVPMRLVQVNPDQNFTVKARIPGFCMTFEHELKPTEAGTRVTHRVTFSGLLAPLLGRLIGPQIDAGLPLTLASLKNKAEVTSNTSA